MSEFVRELLLGPDALPPAKRASIARYLRSVMEQRGFPLHTAVLWNALYFDWDLDEGSYRGATLNLDRIEERRFGDVDRALPVGAFVRVPAGNSEVWGEVIYKEGRHPDVRDDGVVPPHVSGATGVVERGEVALRELLVCDWEAFGPEFNRRTVIDRLSRRGQLDADGHLLMTACYQPGQAELDDATYYAQYLVEHHREGLLAEYVTDATTEAELYEMLLNSFRAVEDIASGLSSTLRWNRYFLRRERYTRFLTDQGAYTPVGADFFASVFKALALPPTARDRVGYAAVSPTIRDHLAGNELSVAEQAALHGPGWARLVCYVNTYVAERVRTEGARVTALGQPYHLRRDDAWQSGGVWRTERLTATTDSPWSVYPPLMTLGLGAAGIDGGAAPAPPPAPGDHEPEPERIGEREWVSVVTLSALDNEALRIPEAALRLLPPRTERVRLRIFEAGRARPILDARPDLDRAATALRGVPYDMRFVAGIKMYCSLQRGSDVIRAEIRPVHPPIVIDGERVEYEVDSAVFSGGRRRRPLQPGEMRRASTLSELIGRAFSSRGERLPDGGRVLHVGDLGAIVLGHRAEPAAWGPLLRELAAMDLGRTEDGRLVWRPQITRRTSLGEVSRLTEAATERTDRLRARLRPHVVLMHLRRWQHRDPGTWAARAASYPDALRRHHGHGRLSTTLPAGHTYVRQYEKGSREAEAAGTDEIHESDVISEIAPHEGEEP